MRNSTTLVFTAVVAIATIASGCQKKAVSATPAPPTPTAAQTPPARPAPTPEAARTPQQTAATTPRSQFPTAKEQARIEELLAKIEDAYFDYDQHTLRADAIQTLQGDSAELRDIISQYPAYKLMIEGHCDERGSEEYNRALGDARAQAAKDYLVGVGISSTQLGVVSYGKDKPSCDEHSEACWQKNRRIHIVAANR
jgi:peptidoglycan-associated lipoprotein